jgi:hypothetical protein
LITTSKGSGPALRGKFSMPSVETFMQMAATNFVSPCPKTRKARRVRVISGKRTNSGRHISLTGFGIGFSIVYVEMACPV